MPDIFQSTATTATISVGQTVIGTIDYTFDRDWYAIDLSAGESIAIWQNGIQIDDPFIRIYSPDGSTQLAFNDDEGAGTLDSYLEFTAASTATYYISAGTYEGSYGTLNAVRTGTYSLSVSQLSAGSGGSSGSGGSGNSATSVLDSINWGDAQPDTTVTVYFAPSGTSADGYTSEGWNSYERAQIQAVFDMIEAVCGLEFNIVTSATNADLYMVLDLNELESDTLGYFNPPETTNAGVGVFNGNNWDRSAGGDLEVGGYGLVTVGHELMHALGFAHPHDVGGTSTVMTGVDSAFDDYGSYNLNQGVFTTMSYNSGNPNGVEGQAGVTSWGGNFGYEAGPMALDIALLQDLYGENETYARGNNTYLLPDARESGTAWQCIWDTGGTDTIRYNGSRSTTIDLRPATIAYDAGGGGYISAASNMPGGYTIAQGVRIERAVGGSNADLLQGNNIGNRLSGRGGDDRILGEGGRDRLLGGSGDDRLVGGRGNDKLFGGTDDDVLIGNSGRDRLSGGSGDDILNGGGAVDYLRGGRGNDTFVFSSANGRDVVRDFGVGNDQLDFRVDADRTIGGNQDFTWIGTRGFSGDAGELRIDVRSSSTLILGDRDGDGVADLRVLVRGVTDLERGDFVL